MSEFFVSTPGSLTGNGFSLDFNAPGSKVDAPNGSGDSLKIVAGAAGGTFKTAGNTPVNFTGGAGSDFVSAGDGDNFLSGGDGDDILVAGKGKDGLDGGAGNDKLFGGAGKDIMTGGEGKDIFRFGAISSNSTVKKSRIDIITDFNPDDDLIQLNRKLTPGLGKITKKNFAVVNKLTDSVTQQLVYELKTGILYFNPKNGGNEVPLMKLPKGLTGLTADNFETFKNGDAPLF